MEPEFRGIRAWELPDSPEPLSVVRNTVCQKYRLLHWHISEDARTSPATILVIRLKGVGCVKAITLARFWRFYFSAGEAVGGSEYQGSAGVK